MASLTDFVSGIREFALSIRHSFGEPAQAQYAALPYRRRKGRTEFLLITSRETRRWVLPKGWPVSEGDPLQTVIAEAWEEAGLKGEVRPTPIGAYHYPKRLKSGDTVTCRVTVYPFVVRTEKKEFPEAGIRTLRWVSREEAIRMVQEEELKDLLRSAQL